MCDKEEWREIKGFDGVYFVSNYGRVKSIDRVGRNNHFYPGRILKPKTDKNGYKIVNLYNDFGHIDKKIHRLVAEAFIPNPSNYPLINHKNEKPEDNYYLNLEWCTPKYNSNYGTRNKRISEAQKKVPREYMQGDKNYFHTHIYKRKDHPFARKVNQYDLDGNLIAVFYCMEDAAEAVGCSPSAISMACRGLRDKIKGFKWSYVE